MASHEHPAALTPGPNATSVFDETPGIKPSTSGLKVSTSLGSRPDEAVTIDHPVDHEQPGGLPSGESSTLPLGHHLELCPDGGAYRFRSADDEAMGERHLPPRPTGSAEEDVHPLLSALPAISALPPLLHRYTGTTTESLLVGVTCCMINIALYITSGVFTRILQQQEHVATQHARPPDASSPPCALDLGGKPSADCGVSTPEVVIERLRVPYLMVWLPQACQVIFLFIALASIRRKYHRRAVLCEAEETGPRGELECMRIQEGVRTSPTTTSERDVEAPSPGQRTSDPAAQQLSLPKRSHHTDHSTAEDASPALPSAPGNHANSDALRHGRGSSLENESLTHSLKDKSNASTLEEGGDGGSNAAASTQSSDWLHAGWMRRLAYQNHVRVCMKQANEHYLCVQAFLKEEMHYEGLGKLMTACFLVMCLYLLQGWFWSIAVGSTGMSVCSVTAIYSTNSLFVFLFTSLIYKEGADDFIQIIALILATVGVALIAYDSQGEPQSTNGVVLSICSSATYGLFEVLYKMYLLQNRSNHPLTFVFFVSGVMGALSLLFMWVPIPLLHALDWETFPSSPPPFLAIFLLFLSCICSSIYTILLQISLMLLPSPMLVAMCFLLSLPPAAASDALRGGGGGVGSPGCAFIAFALIITGIKEWNLKEREEQQQPPPFNELCAPFVLSSDLRLTSDLSRGSGHELTQI
ncbi:hypothetical protein ACSSS7_006445 [Eimeria intestinalis]